MREMADSASHSLVAALRCAIQWVSVCELVATMVSGLKAAASYGCSHHPLAYRYSAIAHEAGLALLAATHPTAGLG